MASTTLRCEQCAFENEPERVYCHNCGAKLDRTLLPKAEEDRKHEAPEQARRRIKKITNPGSSPVTREIKALLTTLIWAVIVAALLLMARPPEGIPDAKKQLSSRLVQSDLMEAVESPVPRTLAFSEDDLNLALKQSLRGQDGGMLLKFERAFVDLKPGTVRVTTHRSLWGYSFYSAALYRVDMQDGQYRSKLIGGSYGRLPVHGAVMAYLDYPFRGLWSALKRQRAYLDRMQTITIGDGAVTLVSKGGAPR